MSWMTWMSASAFGSGQSAVHCQAGLPVAVTEDRSLGKDKLTSTRAFNRSMRWLISRYDLAALYNGSRSGNVLLVSFTSVTSRRNSPEELG